MSQPDSQKTEPVTAPVFLRPVALPGTELLTVTQSTLRWRVFHERYNICTVASAASDYRYRGKDAFLCDGGTMFIQPGETHVVKKIAKPADFRIFWLDTAEFESAAQEFGISGAPNFRLTQDHNPLIHDAFERLHDCIVKNESPLEQQSRLVSCLRLLLGSYVEGASPRFARSESKNRAALMRAEMYLRENFSEPVTLDLLSSVAGMSRFHLVRSFAKQFGLSPHAYQVSLRVSRALELLRSGALVGTAATLAGFADQSHFVRHYKKTFCLTPQQYLSMTKNSRPHD